MNHKIRVAVATASLLATAAVVSTSASAENESTMPVYEMRDLGTLGGKETQAVDINDAGQVTGSSATADGWRRAFIYADGEMTDLGTLRSIPAGSGNSAGAAINKKGQVAGQSDTNDGLYHAVRYSEGEVKDLGTLGGPLSSASSINESGQVAGIAFLPGVSQYHAFFYSDATGLKDIGTLGDSFSTGDRLNDAGEVAGIYQNRFETHAYLYTHGSLVDLLPPGVSSFVPPGRVVLNSAGHVTGTFRSNNTTRSFLYRDGSITDLGTLGGPQAFATAISETDQITGDSTAATSTNAHAFRWSAGQMQDLGTLGGAFSNGIAINAAGAVTGQAATTEGPYHPFVHANGSMIDLGLPEGGIQGSGVAINALGQVTGFYQVPSGERFPPFFLRGFIATPVKVLFSKLADSAGKAGPGTILRDTIRLAAFYYDRGDARRTCGTLTLVEIEASLLARNKRLREQMTDLLADARALKMTLGCMTNSSPYDPQLSKTAPADNLPTAKALSSNDNDDALRWYRERLGIGADGMLIDGRLRIEPVAAPKTSSGDF